MTELKITPGPWRFRVDDEPLCEGEQTYFVEQAPKEQEESGGPGWIERQVAIVHSAYDAQLISIAPLMLSALIAAQKVENQGVGCGRCGEGLCRSCEALSLKSRELRLKALGILTNFAGTQAAQ